MEIPAGFFNVSFNKAMAFGYRTDDVDEFVTQALNIAKALQEENATLQQKLEVLASNLENYREEEDSLRSALIGAQKLGDSILKDSRQKAEKIISEATGRANQITSEAATRVDKQQYELEQLQAETVEFKEKLFSLYRTHLDIIKNIPSDYDDNRKKPRPKIQPPAQPAIAESEPEKDEQDETGHQPNAIENGSYDERSSAVYSPSYTVSSDDEAYDNNVADDDYSEIEPSMEQLTEEPEYIQDDEQEDYIDSPYIIDEPESDKSFTAPPSYVETDDYDEAYEEDYEAPQVLPSAAVKTIPHAQDDVAIYTPQKRKVEEPHPFATPPMVQLEFDTGDHDEYDDDEFAAEKKLMREANLNRIPYLDDDDDDDFAVQLTSKKKPVVSQKFGVLKFGDAFNLRDD